MADTNAPHSIWRPLRRVTAWPLAFCDATTVAAGDLIHCDIVRRRFVGETLFAKHNPGHKWYYLSNQDVNEVAVLQIYDSAVPGSSKCRFLMDETFRNCGFGCRLTS